MSLAVSRAGQHNRNTSVRRSIMLLGSGFRNKTYLWHTSKGTSLSSYSLHLFLEIFVVHKKKKRSKVTHTILFSGFHTSHIPIWNNFHASVEMLSVLIRGCPIHTCVVSILLQTYNVANLRLVEVHRRRSGGGGRTYGS